MRRDMDLIREMLIQIEAHPYFPDKFNDDPTVDFKLESYSHKLVWYHLKLLSDAGFTYTAGCREGFIYVKGLTWEGQEFLDLIKQDKAWNRAKNAMKTTGGMAFEVLVKVLLQMATTAAITAISQ